MSDSTWHFITPFPLFGMVVREYGAAETCVDVTGNVWEDIWSSGLIDCLLGNDSMYKMGASTIHYSISTTTPLVPTLYPLTVPAAREPGTRSTTSTTPTVVRSRPRSSCDPVTHHIATERRLRPSSSVHRELTAASSSVLPPSRWPTPAGRRGYVRSAVLPPRSSHATSVQHWLTWATSFRITILTELPSVHTYLSSSYLRYLKHSTEQLAAVSF